MSRNAKHCSLWATAVHVAFCVGCTACCTVFSRPSRVVVLRARPRGGGRGTRAAAGSRGRAGCGGGGAYLQRPLWASSSAACPPLVLHWSFADEYIFLPRCKRNRANLNRETACFAGLKNRLSRQHVVVNGVPSRPQEVSSSVPHGSQAFVVCIARG